MNFFIGLHNVYDAHRFQRCCISVNRFRDRKSDFAVNDWILDSGAFTEISTYGRYRHEPQEYAGHIARWAQCGNLLAAVSQDWMCEPFIVKKTGLSVLEHQRLTVERYDALMVCDPPAYIMPVIQGFEPRQYARHIEDYGDRLTEGMWVGVGSVCKRNGNPSSVYDVLSMIKSVRPDLRLHGFGVKFTALKHAGVFEFLDTADSLAWSFAARRKGGDQHSWLTARAYLDRVEAIEPTEPFQLAMRL